MTRHTTSSLNDALGLAKLPLNGKAVKMGPLMPEGYGRSVMNRILLVASLMCWASSAFGQTAFFGPGANSCSLFTKLYQSEPEIHELLFFAWAQGFMSGMNAVALKLKGEVIDLSPADYDQTQQKRFLRTYCSEHPLRPYVHGVSELMTELREASGY